MDFKNELKSLLYKSKDLDLDELVILIDKLRIKSKSSDLKLLHYKLINEFTEESKNHVGKKFNEVPELMERLNGINIIEKYLN